MATTTAAYVARMRADVDGTAEVAAGVIAGTGHHQLASGVIVATCLLLLEKSRLHALVERLDDVGLRAAVRFAVLALVVLPLLPESPHGPFGGVWPGRGQRMLCSRVLIAIAVLNLPLLPHVLPYLALRRSSPRRWRPYGFAA